MASNNWVVVVVVDLVYSASPFRSETLVALEAASACGASLFQAPCVGVRFDTAIPSQELDLDHNGRRNLVRVELAAVVEVACARDNLPASFYSSDGLEVPVGGRAYQTQISFAHLMQILDQKLVAAYYLQVEI